MLATKQLRCNRRPSFQKYIHRLVLLLITCLLCEIPWANGGNCFLNMNKNARCTALVKVGSTKEECCNSGPLAGTASAAWSEGELTPSSWFYMHIQGGVPCSRCKDTCDGIKCQDDQKCVVKNGVPKCTCAPDCNAFRAQNGIKGHHRGPVCGSDGRTYRTPCRLLKRACRRKIAISISYMGPCKMHCSRIACSGDKQCLFDQNMTPHCVNCATRTCSTAKGKSVCGVDGVTYPNLCQLRQNACQKGRAIQIAYKGPCKKRANCGSIKCGEGQSCLVELFTNKPRCVTCGAQPKWCQGSEKSGNVKGPICSTNGETFNNWCEMTEHACKIGTALDTKHFGRCRGSSRPANFTLPISSSS